MFSCVSCPLGPHRVCTGLLPAHGLPVLSCTSPRHCRPGLEVVWQQKLTSRYISKRVMASSMSTWPLVIGGRPFRVFCFKPCCKERDGRVISMADKLLVWRDGRRAPTSRREAVTSLSLRGTVHLIPGAQRIHLPGALHAAQTHRHFIQTNAVRGRFPDGLSG